MKITFVQNIVSDMAQLITARLSRSDGSPWGFRLQGGKDFGTPLALQKVINPVIIVSLICIQKTLLLTLHLHIATVTYRCGRKNHC